ncbi:MAG: ABC transporter permease subunit [Actinobacteria bacterium]|nr:ABC transporter permease subunit [Actinomycetota bacterium]
MLLGACAAAGLVRWGLGKIDRSVVAGLVGVLVLVIGVVVGTISSYLGGWTDDLLMRMTELLQVLPRFFLAIVVIAFFGAGYDRLILLLGLTSWPSLARVARAEVLSLRERAFVEAARAVGGSTAHILFRHVLPNITVPLAVVAGATASAALSSVVTTSSPLSSR